MTHIIIRSFPKDEFLAALCLASFKRANFKGEYSFLLDGIAENYMHLSNNGYRCYYHPTCGNFGGQLGVKGLQWGLKQIAINAEDHIILSDSDIVLKTNNFEGLFGFAHFGKGGLDRGLGHISGQFQSFHGHVVKKFCGLSIEEIDTIVYEMQAIGYNIADDTFLSYLTDKWNCTKFYTKNIDNAYWLHEKLYKYFDEITLTKGLEVAIIESILDKVLYDYR